MLWLVDLLLLDIFVIFFHGFRHRGGGGNAGDVSSRFELPGDVPPQIVIFKENLYIFVNIFRFSNVFKIK